MKKIYYMPKSTFKDLGHILTKDNHMTVNELETLIEKNYGMRDTYKDDAVESLDGYFDYEIVDEKKFVRYVLKFG